MKNIKLLLTLIAALSFVGVALAQMTVPTVVLVYTNASGGLTYVTNPVTVAPGASGVGTILANVPTSPLTNETVGVCEGMLMRQDSTFSSATMIDWSPTSVFFVRGEIDSGTTANGIEATGFGGGLYKNMGPTRVYVFGEGRRQFTSQSAVATPGQAGGSWDGLIGVGAAWAPTTNGMLANFSIMAEDRLVETCNKALSSVPHNEFFSGARYSF